MRPAITIELPDDISTVVSARRVAGGNRAFAGEFADLGRDLERHAPAGHHYRREREADAEGLELNRDLAVVAVDRHRELAAGEEARRLAGDGGQVWFG
jgi:hypothetical protein